MDKETMISAINSKFEELKTALEGDAVQKLFRYAGSFGIHIG